MRKVTIRIWPSQSSSSSPTMFTNPGHAALLTEHYYVSFWPRDCCNKRSPEKKEICNQSTDHFHTKNIDDLLNPLGSAIEIDFYTLDVDRINFECNRLLQMPVPTWEVLGKNCSGLCWELLKVGGVELLLDDAKKFTTAFKYLILTGVLAGGSWLAFKLFQYSLLSAIFSFTRAKRSILDNMAGSNPVIYGALAISGCFMLASNWNFLAASVNAIVTTPEGLLQICNCVPEEQKKEYRLKL